MKPSTLRLMTAAFLAAVSFLAAPYAQAAVQIKAKAGFCLDASAPGAVVQQACNAVAAAQLFDNSAKPGQYLQAGKCLGGTPNANGTQLALVDCAAADAQWTFAGGTLKQAAGRCIDIPGPQAAIAGTKAQLWDCDGSAEQQFTLESVAIATSTTTASPAGTTPTCKPATPLDVRVGVTINADGSAAGAWAYWWCVIGGQVTYNWRAAPASTFTGSLLAQLRAYSSGTAPDFIATPTTLASDAPQLAAMRADIAKAVAADTGKPVVPSYVVAKNGTAADRPAFAVVNGKRQLASKSRAAVGAACDCTALKFVEGSLTYCQTAPSTVAVCTPATTTP